MLLTAAVATGLAAAGYVSILVSAGELESYETWGSIGRYWIGEFNGIIALTPLLLLRGDLSNLRDVLRRHPREVILQCVGATAGVALAFALAAAHDVRLFYPLFVPVTWIALRRGVPGAMLSVTLVQAALVAALELTPGSIPLFDVQFPLLSLGITALFLGALTTQRDAVLHQMREQDSALQRAMRFAVAGQLASALAHELNQPMTALLSYVRASELMAEPLALPDGRLTTSLRKAGEEAIRAADVLRRLREFYRGEGVRLEQVNTATLCAHVVAALHLRTQRSGVEVEMRIAEDLPAVVVDRTQLEIVIHNLLTNSLDAFDALPAARHPSRRIEITAQARGSDVLVAVEDSGPGISASVAARLFEPFVTSKVSGMGLGLSISRSFLRSQGGDLQVERGQLGGARFVIHLATTDTGQTAQSAKAGWMLRMFLSMSAMAFGATAPISQREKFTTGPQATPKTTPRTPPMPVSTSDSMRNCRAQRSSSSMTIREYATRWPCCFLSKAFEPSCSRLPNRSSTPIRQSGPVVCSRICACPA